MTVVITGANRGIGRALFDGYAARGDEVVGTTRNSEPGAGFVTLDVTDPASQTNLGQRLDCVPVELLVCNAGVYLDKQDSLADGYPADMWANTFATNVTGVFLTVQTLLANLQLADNARIAIISSQMGSSTHAKGTSLIYRVSKAAALNLGFNLSTALAGLDIAVGIYHPGWVKTDMGGVAADISTEDTRDGLMARFDALTPETSGEFLTWDGRPHAL